MPAKIIITRPKAQASRFAEDLQSAAGRKLSVLIAPLMEIVPISPPTHIRSTAHVIFTSANAVNQVGALDIPRDITAWCVGQQTGDAASSAGFPTKIAHGDSADLVAMLIKARPLGPLLHLRGQHATGHVAQSLSQAGFDCAEVVVYAQKPQPATEALIETLKGSDSLVAPLFSPRSARLLGESAEIRGNLTAVAISPAVAAVAGDWPVKAVVTANSPDKSGMIAATLAAYDAVSDPNTP